MVEDLSNDNYDVKSTGNAKDGPKSNSVYPIQSDLLLDTRENRLSGHSVKQKRGQSQLTYQRQSSFIGSMDQQDVSFRIDARAKAGRSAV